MPFHPLRVLLAEVGPGSHDRSGTTLARALRGAGMDVIYAGVHRTAGEVVTAAVHEDVDILGVTLLAGAPSTVVAEVLQRLAERQREDTVVVAGGVIPDQDIARLKQLGVREFLGQDAPSRATIDALRRWVDERGPR